MVKTSKRKPKDSFPHSLLVVEKWGKKFGYPVERKTGKTGEGKEMPIFIFSHGPYPFQVADINGITHTKIVMTFRQEQVDAFNAESEEFKKKFILLFNNLTLTVTDK